MLNVWNSKCTPRSLEAEEHLHRSTLNGGRRNLKVSGPASSSQIFPGVMPGTDVFTQSGKYPPRPSK